MTEANHRQPESTVLCGCFTAPYNHLENHKELGMDDKYAVVSLLICSVCGQVWLRYFYEIEAFTASGRWYLGAIQAEQAALMTLENAKVALESLAWYFYGGSYYGGQSGRSSGQIYLNP